MSLTQDDKRDLIEILKNNKPSNIFDGNLTEWLFRGLLALLLFLGNNIRVEQQKQGEDITEVKSNILQIKTENAYYGKDVETFRGILAKPRFTKEDFDQNINPVLKQLNANTTELNLRNTRIGGMERQITKLEYQVQEILKLKE